MRLGSLGWKAAWRGLAWLGAFGLWIVLSSPLRNALADVGGVVFAVTVSTVFGFVVWLATPAILLGASTGGVFFRAPWSPRCWARCSARRRASTYR